MHKAFVGFFGCAFGDHANGRIFEVEDEDDCDYEHGYSKEAKEYNLVLGHHEKP